MVFQNKDRARVFVSWLFSSVLLGSVCFFAALGLKLDGLINWKYFEIFNPIWINNYLLFFSLMLAVLNPRRVFNHWRIKVSKTFCVIMIFCFLLPSFLLEVWLCLKMDQQLPFTLTHLVFLEFGLISTTLVWSIN
jgi:hypothetical protein